jgi:predicted nucleotidyltransferase
LNGAHRLGYTWFKGNEMKTLDQINLTPNQQQALSELRERLSGSFEIVTMTLYGSVVRGEAEDESDLDLLIVTARSLPRPVRHQITDIVFEINLRCGTNFSTLVVDRVSWESGLFSVLPLHDEIVREGVPAL